MDGHSPMLAATNPAMVIYDPAYGYEIAHIMKSGLERMYGENPEDVIYYLTVYNEPVVQPAEPENIDTEGIVKGMYLLKEGSFEGVNPDARRAQLLASGVGVAWALEAQELLKKDYGIVADVWSVTSWTELRREAMECDEHNFTLNPDAGAPRAVRHPETRRPGRWWRCPTSCVRCRTRSPSGCRSRWASLGRTGLGFSDTALPRAGSSTSTVPRWRSARCRCSRKPARSTRRGRARPLSGIASTT